MEQALPKPRAEAGARRHAGGLKVALYLGALVALGAAGSWLHPALSGQGTAGNEQDGAGWEGRRLVAQVLWARSETVLHAGMEERDARAGEETRSEFHEHAGDGHEEHGHEEGHAEESHGGGKVLVIPPAREDFRGILGDLERQVKPYMGANGQMYSKDAAQTLPFYRLMTWADPHFVQGYTNGATFMSEGGKRADEGLRFLHEGERFNPGSFEIQTELGHFYLVYKRDYPRATRHLRRALDLVPARKLDELEADAYLDAYRWLVLTYVEAGHPAEALRLAQNGLHLWPSDPTLRGAVARKGHPATSHHGDTETQREHGEG